MICSADDACNTRRTTTSTSNFSASPHCLAGLRPFTLCRVKLSEREALLELYATADVGETRATASEALGLRSS